MAIPGLKASYDVRAKVRIGEKRATASGSTRPASTDYFLSDDPEFASLCGDKPKTLRIQLPHASADDNFSTGMEWWRGKQLACYSKGEQDLSPTLPGTHTKAYRVIAVLDADDHEMGAPMGRGNERQPIVCRFRECKHFGKNANNKECRVMGRLVFFLDGGRTDSVLEIDTKSWNSIEQLEASLAGLARTGPLNAPGRVYDLTVEMRQSGRDRFPVLNISEADVLVTDDKIPLADELLKLDATLSAEGLDDRELAIKRQLCVCLDLSNPGWRDKPAVIGKLREQGAEAAARSYLERQLA